MAERKKEERFLWLEKNTILYKTMLALLVLLALNLLLASVTASTHRPPPLFILAEGRSGSSFLGQLFDADPNFKYVFEPERHSQPEEIASLLRCDGTLTPNAASRLLWRCESSSWCRSRLLAESNGYDDENIILAQSLADDCTNDSRPLALKMIRRGGGSNGSRYVDLSTLSREVDLTDARVVVVSRDPRAVVTSQIRHVRWHVTEDKEDKEDKDGKEGDDRWGDVANDVCRAHKRRVSQARARGGVVVSYEDLVRAPLQTMASLYLDLGIGALPKEIVRYIRSSELAPEENAKNLKNGCRNETLRRVDPDAWSEACYAVRGLVSVRRNIGRWRGEATLHQIRRMEEAKECGDVFVSAEKGDVVTHTWPTFPIAGPRLVRVIISGDPAR
jgi:hypothetical protein